MHTSILVTEQRKQTQNECNKTPQFDLYFLKQAIKYRKNVLKEILNSSKFEVFEQVFGLIF